MKEIITRLLMQLLNTKTAPENSKELRKKAVTTAQKAKAYAQKLEREKRKHR